MRIGKLNSKILCVDAMPFPHSRVELSAKVFQFLKEWGLRKRYFLFTLDNASSNDNMHDILKERLSLNGSLLCDGEFLHVSCSAQILSTIVQESLKAINSTLRKIRESVIYVTGSVGRLKMFEECASAFGNIDTNVRLRSDMTTRWDTTYLMLDSAIKYKKAFASLQLTDKDYKSCPSAEEWKRAEKICEFLEPFYDTNNVISGSSFPTSNLYFMHVWKIEVTLMKNLSNEDVFISDMCRKMKDEFDKYWSQYSIVLAFGAVLDPRIKLSMLDYFYSKVESDPIKCQETISLVKTKLHMLFEHYANATKPSSSKPQPSSAIHSPMPMKSGSEGAIKSTGKRIFDEICAYESQTVANYGKSQLDLYLEEPKLQFSYYEDLDVLEYWKNHKRRYPDLALMARDILAIPVTSAISESAFSVGAHVLTKYKSCCLPQNVQALICIRNWLRGYVTGSEEIESLIVTLSGEDSNDPDSTDDDGSENDLDIIDDDDSENDLDISDEDDSESDGEEKR